MPHLLLSIILIMSTQPTPAQAEALRKMEEHLQAYFAIKAQSAPRLATRIKYHPAQLQIRREAKRFNVLDCGRRFGKTKFQCDLLVETAQQGDPAGYFAPTYKHLMDGWRDLLDMSAPILARKDEQEKRIELTTGGVIECWSLDGDGGGTGKKTYKAGRSRKYKRVVIDEAALVGPLVEIFDYAISPTLIDLKGDAWFGSTPNGKNGFYKLFRQGQKDSATYDEDWMSWKMPTSVNPYIPPEEIEREKRKKADHVFRQEYLAEFLEDSGQVFRNIAACTRTKAQIWQNSALPYHVYIIAWDLAKKEDFSVLGVIDCTTKQLVHTDHFNHVEYMLQIPRLIALAEKFQPVEVVVEKNGNLALMEVLRIVKYQKKGPAPRYYQDLNANDDYTNEQLMLAEASLRQLNDVLQLGITHPATMPITEFDATNATKEEAVQALVLAFERGEIAIPDEPELIDELEAFGMERLPSGRFKYEAPAGSHDDFVMMLSEGWYRARRYMSIENLPVRERAMRRLSKELQPDNIMNNPSEMAQVSQEYWLNAYEKEINQSQSNGGHFMSRFAGLGR